MKVPNHLKSISADFVLNIVASFIATGTLQLIVYPLLARKLDSNAYGIVLTIMGTANTIVATIGVSLNNTRILVNEDYEKKNVSGDFLPILLLLNIVAVVVYFFLSLKNNQSSLLTTILVCVYAFLGSIRTYGSVAYRIVINYKKNLFCSFFIALGNFIGIMIYYHSDISAEIWPLPFILGEILGIIYIRLSSNVFDDKFIFTALVKRTICKESILLLTTLSGNLLLYLDRLVLLPLLGGESVTIYTVASVFGKSIGVLMSPIAGVLLSYFFQSGFIMGRRKYWIINLTYIIATGIFIGVSAIFGRWFTGILYPTVIGKADKYVFIANLSAIIIVFSNLIQPSVLKIAPTYWQLLIQVLYIILYLGNGVVMTKQYGLYGFAVAALIASIIKTVILLVIGDRYSRKKYEDRSL